MGKSRWKLGGKMSKVTCIKCQRLVEASLAQKCDHCEVEPFCETCIDMQAHSCKGKPMDENDTQDLLLALVNAVDDLQAVRGSNEKAEDEAFEVLLQLRNDVASAHYA